MPNEVDMHYQAWKAKPSPESLSQVVKALSPTINYALGAVNASDDPVVRSQAMLHAADAVERYDPKNPNQASLPTYVSAHLRQLNRLARQQRMPVKVPEKIQLDAYHLHRKSQEFLDQNNREPDVLELADFSGLPVHRIEKVRLHQVTTPSEAAGVAGSQSEPAYDREALEYIHTGSDHIDRRILEFKTGFGGSPMLPPQEIAARLKLTPSQLSRRSMRLAQRIGETQQRLTNL